MQYSDEKHQIVNAISAIMENIPNEIREYFKVFFLKSLNSSNTILII